jgi:sigma-B regulation protein RsbU (phosphoserine phosphatase)
VKSPIRTNEHRLQQIRKLTDVSRAITYAASLDEVFKLTVGRAADLFDAQRVALMVSSDNGLLALRASHGVDAALAERFHEPLNEALVSRLAEFLDAQPESFLAVPLVVGGAIKGLLVVVRPTSSAAAEEDEWLLSALADQAAVALEKKRLDELGEFREQLIGIVGHDLVNPLSTILIAGQLLLEREGLGEYATELARKITGNASLAVRLIEQLLDFTRSRLGGGIPIDPKPFDMNDVVRQAIGGTELMHPDRPLNLDVKGDVTGVWDRDRMYQVLANLVGNAVHHGEARSSIDLRIDGRKTEVVIEVTNRGNAIPPATLPFIFDPFRHGRADHASKTRGLGLGLFIVRQIIRSHGGSIAVTSSEREGTTFRVVLPRSSGPGPSG